MAEIFREQGKAAWTVLGSKFGPAHDRKWVDSGTAGSSYARE
jgi:hypothetical protein